MDLQTSVLHSQRLRALHKPGTPLVLANIYDLSSLYALLSLNTATNTPVQAIATASYAIAESLGVRDADLTYEAHFSSLSPIATHVRAADLPLTIDLQDGYGTRLEEAITSAIRLGAVGANIEDSFPDQGFSKGVEGSLRSTEEQVQRIRTALRVAADLGVPDFVINARTDVLRLDPCPEDALHQAVERGMAYLEAGATTVFVWGGSGRGISDKEVNVLVRAFRGMLAVKLSDREDGLSVEELGEIGVARISIGPSLWIAATETIVQTAGRILQGGKLHG